MKPNSAPSDDPRIGMRDDNGLCFPHVSISGQPYQRPATLREIGGGRFVVIDLFPGVDVEAVIAALNAAEGQEDDDRAAAVRETAQDERDHMVDDPVLDSP